MLILYAETSALWPASAHFLEALEGRARRGECEFTFFDEAKYIASKPSLAVRIACRAIGRPAGYRALNAALIAAARDFRPDLVLIGKGAHFAPRTLAAVRSASGAFLVNWATDDPFNPAINSRNLIESIPLYDLYVCTKRAIMDDVRRAGCGQAKYVRFGYKPQVHFPETPVSDAERRRFDCDVMFIGGADADRAPYFETLVRALPTIRLNLFGGQWNRYPMLRRYSRGNAIGRDFRLAAGGAKIAVNLVRRANRDDHVMRTFELPACGAFVLAERTAAHQELFEEEREAVFFSTPDELAAKVLDWLPRGEDRIAVAAAGCRRITHGRHTYADRFKEILTSVPLKSLTAGRRAAD